LICACTTKHQLAGVSNILVSRSTQASQRASSTTSLSLFLNSLEPPQLDQINLTLLIVVSADSVHAAHSLVKGVVAIIVAIGITTNTERTVIAIKDCTE